MRELAARKKRFLQEAKALKFLQTLNPEAFQEFLWAVYRKAGYEVQETPFTKDGGVDGFLMKGASRLVLQCKRYKGDVGESVVRDLFGTATHHKADGAILVTTGRITQPARSFAHGKTIDLIDGKRLLSLLQEVGLSEDHVSDKLVSMLDKGPQVEGVQPVLQTGGHAGDDGGRLPLAVQGAQQVPSPEVPTVQDLLAQCHSCRHTRKWHFGAGACVTWGCTCRVFEP